MFKFIKRLFGLEQPEKAVQVKEEKPFVSRVPATCGCGRSPIGVCVGLHKLTDEEWAVHEKNPNRVNPDEAKAKKAAKKPTKKAVAKKTKS